MQNNKNGFTLIELLVVVLIIGILAAVALPQYQKAVIKSRTSALLPLLTTIANAEEAHYVATGTYTSHLADLDIDAPTNCFLQSHGGGIEEYYACGNDFILNITNAGKRACTIVNNSKIGQQICNSLPNFEITD